MRRVVVVLVSVLFAGLLAGGAVGVIVGASSVPQIHACVGPGGAMIYSLSGHCASGQKVLTWNVQGLPGARGATGPQGQRGPSGNSGGTAAQGFYLANGTGGEVTIGTAWQIASLPVPAGEYIVDVSILLTVPSGAGPASCALGGNGTTQWTSAPFSVYSDFAGGTSGRVYVNAVSATTLSLLCVGGQAYGTPGPNGGTVYSRTRMSGAGQIVASVSKKLN